MCRKSAVHWVPEILFAAQIALRRLHRRMAQQELNLFQLATVAVAQLGTRPPQVMPGNMLQARSLTAGSDDVPDNILREAFAPYLYRPVYGSEDPSLRDPSSQGPLIERGFDPFWNRDGADVPALAD